MSKESREVNSIGILRAWLADKPDAPSFPDAVLRIFLHCREYDMELTKSTIEEYLDLSRKTPEIFSNLDPLQPGILEVMSSINIAVLPQRDLKGRVVIIYKPNEDYTKFHFGNIIKLLCMTTFLAALQAKPGPGFVLIFDYESVKLGHFTRLSIGLLKVFYTFAQDASPINIRNIHAVNTSFITNMVMKLSKPFLQKDLEEKIILHTTNLEKLYEEIPKDILPENYGGLEKSVEELGKENENNLKQNRDLVMQCRGCC